MPNLFAYLMLMIWPLVCLVLFRKLTLERAMIWSILGGYLVLPPVAEFDLPLIPDMDKYLIANVSAFAICVFVMGKKISLWPQSVLARLLVLTFVFSVIATVYNNADEIRFTQARLPGLGMRDLLSVLAGQVIMLLPFFMARQYLSTETGMRELLLALAIGGLAYSIPALIEIRLSPQINTWVYGFFQHSFRQMMRDGGFRPIVFLPHALWLAFFLVMALLSLAALARSSRGKARQRYLLAIAYLMVVLVLSKSLASLAYGLVFTPVVLLASHKMLIRLAMLAALFAVAYPMLRNGGFIPLEAILERAEAFDPDRAQSLGYRFGNEDQLLRRADEKPWFGWGGWGRNLLRDADTGEIVTIPDGRWIIVFGTFGWVGYIAEMGLLALPLFLLGWRMRKRRNTDISPYVAPIAVILAATMVDMLLNATLIPLTWMCAGAVLGYAEQSSRPEPAPEARRRVLFGDGPVIGRAGSGNGGQRGQRPLL